MTKLTTICLVLFATILSACTHTISFRASHFAVPVVSEKQWSGNVAAAFTSSTDVTIVNDITTTPPTRNSVLINKDITASNIFYFNNVGIDADLTFFNSTEVYLDNSLFGLRWQFLNPGGKSQTWVGALQGAYGARTASTSSTSGSVESKAESSIKTSQAGVSIGYQTDKVVPYFSYLYEQHDVTTNVTNSGGSYGPYTDTGKHQYYSLGVASTGAGFKYALEVNLINISWTRATSDSTQNTAGVKLGYAW